MNSTLLSLDVYPAPESKTITTRGIITDVDFRSITNVLDLVSLTVALVGVITNAISIRTFIAMGLGDGITVSLLGLSLSDFGYAACLFVVGSGYVLNIFEVHYGLKSLPVQPRWVVAMFSMNASHVFHQITCLTTAFLGVARCVCVAMPFRFKNYFTRSKSFVAQMIFVSIGISCHVPVLALMGTQRRFDTVVNRTRLVLWISDKRAAIKNSVFVFHYIVLVLITCLTALICAIIMAKHLTQSLHFRDSRSTGKPDGTDVKEDAMSTTKLSGKELQAVRQVMVICSLYTVSISPGLFHALYRPINPDFDVRQRLHNFYIVTSSVKTIFHLANSASTFFVYYAFNSKFRSVLFFSKQCDPKSPNLCRQ